NETLRTLVHASPVAIVVLDGQERVRIWNAAAERIFGWRPHETLGRTMPSLKAPGRTDEFPPLARRVLKGESLANLEFTGSGKSAIPVELSLSMVPLRDGRGAISGAMAVIADISERKTAESQKEHLEDQLRQSQKMEAVGRLAG